MARPLRVEYPGAFYHITARGVAQQAIFFDDADREKLLSLLGQIHEGYGFIFHAYCLMDNHYHLEVETPEANLSRGIQWLGQMYATYVNGRYNRVGHLFQGRFKSVVVERDAYLAALTRYIQLNPVRANLVSHPDDYAWSSYRAYMGKVSKPTWLDTKTTLSQFGSNRKIQQRAFRQFMEEDYVTNPLKELFCGFALGSESFVKKLRDFVGKQKKDSEISGLTRALARVSIEDILIAVREEFGVKEKELQSKWSRKNAARDVAIYLAARLTGENLRRIGEQCGGLSVPATSLACRRVRERIESDKKFQKIVVKLEKKIKH